MVIQQLTYLPQREIFNWKALFRLPDPLGSGMSKFSFDRGKEIIHVSSPFNLILQVLTKIENEKTEWILIVPIFVYQN